MYATYLVVWLFMIPLRHSEIGQYRLIDNGICRSATDAFGVHTPQELLLSVCDSPSTRRADRMRSRALWLLLAAVAEVASAQDRQSAVFVTRQVQHASTPLTTAHGLTSDLQCAVLCLQTADCLKWIRDPVTTECRLLPLHSADNRLTSEPAAVRQRPHPAGYIPMPGGGGVTYRPHSRLTPGGPVQIQLCRQDDPQAVPAFVTNDDQFNFLMTLTFTEAQWLSNNDLAEEGVYRDLFNATVVDIKDNWMKPIPNWFHGGAYDGVAATKTGLMNRPYGDKFSYMCEYWM